MQNVKRFNNSTKATSIGLLVAFFIGLQITQCGLEKATLIVVLIV